MSGVQGNVRKLIEPFLERLIQMIANIEVNIDYPEYDDVEVLTEARDFTRSEAVFRRSR
ncbi:hypothetical protein MX850_07240 [Erysipelothrix sp. Poltava]|nr:hypothetical protein MX850_07240 [Erysipelothrix sp. Poltava]